MFCVFSDRGEEFLQRRPKGSFLFLTIFSPESGVGVDREDIVITQLNVHPNFWAEKSFIDTWQKLHPHAVGTPAFGAEILV